MSEYLLEAYSPLHERGHCAPKAGDVAAEADRLTAEGHPVRLLHSVVVPDDETCFYLFEAESCDAVVEAANRSGLRFERLGVAMSDWHENRNQSKEVRR